MDRQMHRQTEDKQWSLWVHRQTKRHVTRTHHILHIHSNLPSSLTCQVETVWDTVSKIGVDIRAALDQVIRQTDDRSKRKNKGINLGQAFRKVQSFDIPMLY